MKLSEMQKLLDTILTRRSVIKELEKATKVLEAQLETQMAAVGKDKIVSNTGGVAYYMPNTTVKAADMGTLLRTLDARTLAALLSDSTVNKTKQSFLERAYPDGLKNVLVTSRTNSFRIDLPRSAEQQAMITEAIANDVREQEQKIADMLKYWGENIDVTPLPDNPEIDDLLKEDSKPKKKSPVKKGGKK